MIQKKKYWEREYKILCPKHGEVMNKVSGYPPFEKVKCPVKGCTFWLYLKWHPKLKNGRR